MTQARFQPRLSPKAAAIVSLVMGPHRVLHVSKVNYDHDQVRVEEAPPVVSFTHEATTVLVHQLDESIHSNFFMRSEDYKIAVELRDAAKDFLATPQPLPSLPKEISLPTEVEHFEASVQRQRDAIFHQIFGTERCIERDAWGDPIEPGNERTLVDGSSVTITAAGACNGGTITLQEGTGGNVGGTIPLQGGTGGNVGGVLRIQTTGEQVQYPLVANPPQDTSVGLARQYVGVDLAIDCESYSPGQTGVVIAVMEKSATTVTHFESLASFARSAEKAFSTFNSAMKNLAKTLGHIEE